MSCCSRSAAPTDDGLAARAPSAADQELLLASRWVADKVRETTLSVPGIHCGGCIRAIETGLAVLPGIDSARVNLSTKRVSVCWRGEEPPPLLDALKKLGYEGHLQDPDAEGNDTALADLLRALAVAGFATMNIMLLSVSVWAGADLSTRNLFHWISAAIALPALLYSGRIFFRPAWSALRHGRTNMDVPISIGVLMAFGLSLFETMNHGPHAYFDASVTLLFFLLIGRTLDHVMRERARSSVSGLARLGARGASIIRSDGSHEYLPVNAIEPGMRISLSAGERVPVDARVLDGVAEVDCSMVTGESEPRRAEPGAELQSGTLLLAGPLTVTAMASEQNSFLAEMVRLVATAESARSRYRGLADRATGLYAPTVHLAAILSFAAWMISTGDAHRAVTVAVAVLIVTCPCALGLAVPMVQVAAARRLFENGIVAKDGSALERLREIDTVVFDKTGTLTTDAVLVDKGAAADPAHLALAAAMSACSRHPRSRALGIRREADGRSPTFEEVREHPGCGVEAVMDGAVFRLGSPKWALAGNRSSVPCDVTALSRDGELLEVFRFRDRIRPRASEAIATLRRMGLSVEMISGDAFLPVQQVAISLGIDRFISGAKPAEKVAHLTTLAEGGHRALMVGDGLNDAPALSTAHVSMAPASASHIGRNAASFVFLRPTLDAVPHAIAVARRAQSLVRQNLAFAVIYNAAAIPFAALGYVTPLTAALAMSGSSLLVVANSLRILRAGPASPGFPDKSDVSGDCAAKRATA